MQSATDGSTFVESSYLHLIFMNIETSTGESVGSGKQLLIYRLFWEKAFRYDINNFYEIVRNMVQTKRQTTGQNCAKTNLDDLKNARESGTQVYRLRGHFVIFGHVAFLSQRCYLTLAITSSHEEKSRTRRVSHSICVARF